VRWAAGLALTLAVVGSFSSRIEVVAASTLVAGGVAWMVDRRVVRGVVRVGLVLGALFAASIAGAAVAWSAGAERGLLIGATVLLRLVVLASTAAVIARSVDAEAVLRATSRLGLERLGLTLGLALNCLPVLAETASTVWTAHRVRSGSRWTAVRRIPVLAEVLLAHAARVADQAAAAAALRGHASLGRPVAPLVRDVRTVVVTGPSGSGKTPTLLALAAAVRASGRPVAGFVQPAVIADGVKTGFRIRDVASGETRDLATKVDHGGGAFGTSFDFAEEGFELGRRALEGIHPSSVVLVDELGPVELRGGGHWPGVETALRSGRVGALVVAVRPTLVPALIEVLDAEDVVIIDLETRVEDAGDRILEALDVED
jgi:nucleoside-triphosphatase THEP1/energy-coupling factor transporter transmembrane protein EcfT